MFCTNQLNFKQAVMAWSTALSPTLQPNVIPPTCQPNVQPGTALPVALYYLYHFLYCQIPNHLPERGKEAKAKKQLPGSRCKARWHIKHIFHQNTQLLSCLCLKQPLFSLCCQTIISNSDFYEIQQQTVFQLIFSSKV